MDRPVRACWCGGQLGKEVGWHYRICDECGAAVLAVRPAAEHHEVSDDERDFYGRRYWTDHHGLVNLETTMAWTAEIPRSSSHRAARTGGRP